jgi:hypothetical protein
MAFADPQSVTVAAVPVTLPRTSSGANAGSFTSNDGLVQLSVSSSYGKRTRRTVRLSHAKVAADPFISGQNVKYSMSTYVVIDTPLSGYTVAQAKEVVDALVAYLTASTGARVTQILGGEN